MEPNVEEKAARAVSREDWLTARLELLAAEKALTRRRDEVARLRRALPFVRLDKTYTFEGAKGRSSLADLFAGRSQLLVQHLMFAPDAAAPCKSCSFWADHMDASLPHLAARDVSFAAVSRAAPAKLAAHARRLGWRFPWVSSGDGDFNFDFAVSFEEGEPRRGPGTYNYAPSTVASGERPGFSAFYRSEDGAIFHAYSTYGRGLDALNGTYALLDLMPKGRDEDALAFPMAWVRFRDEYAA
ncbi:MAG: DUF899 domain-containing protein [Alphaproteobacteria bacterium]|nr:DUF899 domain-containing protein [Alphaproteobacteria bacterium]